MNQIQIKYKMFSIKFSTKSCIGLLMTLFIFSCEENTAYKQRLKNPEQFLGAAKQLSDVIVYDIFSPPVASRIYAYSSIAAYESVRQAYPEKYVSLSGQLNGLEPVPRATNENINYHLASVHAFLTVGKALIFSEEKMDTYREQLYRELKKKGLPNDVMKTSLAYGDVVANHILEWANKDMYKQTRTYPKYTIVKMDSLWKPTPPDYKEGIEPHWAKIRPMTLDSAQQFPPIPPLNFNLDPSSEFSKQLTEVFEVGNNLDEEQRAVASFWDCNPYVSHHRGHAMFATKKITPGGHWMGIAAVASRKAGSSFDETIETHAMVSIALFDAFISCWDGKWKSLLVRPETLINQYLDEDWLPLLQTPPFPEYTSGHSVISRAAAITLTDLYGEGFAFTDTVEIEFGLPARKFNGFLEASEEAAISRLYGGIHYKMAINNGLIQGEQVGKHVVNSIRTRVNNK